MNVSLDQLRAFLSQQPPRVVPTNIRKKAMKRIPTAFIFVGLIISLFGLPFLLIFFPWRLADDIRLNKDAVTTSDGIVQAVTETSMSENDRRVFRCQFSFRTDDGTTHSGTCYTTHPTFRNRKRVTVEYLAADPDVARIKDCRLSGFGWGSVLTIIFPGVGVLVLFFTIRARRRLGRLLVNGQFSAGRILSVDPSNVTVNNQRQYRVTVSFSDGFDERTTKYSALGDAVALAQEKCKDEDTVGVLYNPSNPKRVFLVDELVDR